MSSIETALETEPRPNAPLNILTIEGERPNEIAQILFERFGVEGEVLEDRVVAATDEGHALLPKIVEAFPPGRLHAVSLRQRAPGFS